MARKSLAKTRKVRRRSNKAVRRTGKVGRKSSRAVRRNSRAVRRNSRVVRRSSRAVRRSRKGKTGVRGGFINKYTRPMAAPFREVGRMIRGHQTRNGNHDDFGELNRDSRAMHLRTKVVNMKPYFEQGIQNFKQGIQPGSV